MTKDASCPVRFDASRRAWVVRDVASAQIVLGRHALFGTQGYETMGPDLADIRRFLTAPPERHRMLRRLMIHAFAPRRVAEIDAAVLRPAADELASSLPGPGTVDLQSRYVGPYTRRIMYDVMGLTEVEGDELTAAFRITRGYWVEQADRERGLAALHLLRQRAASICAADGERPGVSLLGLAGRERWLATDLDVEDLVCMIMSLVEAAAVKAHRDLTATLLRRVAAMPTADQTRLLRTDAFFEAAGEAVRLQPGGYAPRVALVDTKLEDQVIRAGDRVYVALGEVGLDALTFSEPERFCPWRQDLDSAVSFGIGIHRCVGENIARRIAARASREVLRRWQLTLVAERDTTFNVTLDSWR
ncbi:cytochrome P450 [Nonomuraea sp. NPDC046802]|uniref:cytochrome P450 n=1 Tax=Nonomuraea sp. NPDC046802 TaxID=3154919 RepID=UPI0033E77981